MRFYRLILSIALAGFTVGSMTGCRTVWQHPEATHKKYSRDLYWCRFGIEPDVAAESRARPRVHRDWGLCMESLGWSRAIGLRWEDPYTQSVQEWQRLF